VLSWMIETSLADRIEDRQRVITGVVASAVWEVGRVGQAGGSIFRPPLVAPPAPLVPTALAAVPSEAEGPGRSPKSL
jgi:hypothetical protein